MEIDWIYISYLVIGFFAVLGFFRGWWKEAMTSVALALLIVLLQQPTWAAAVVDLLNQAIATGLNLAARVAPIPFEVPQIEAGRPSTWLIILLALLGLSAFIGRLILPGTANRLPGQYYAVNPIGRLLGGLLGGINGFLVLGLVREYIDGRALPGRTPPETTISLAGGSSFGTASQTLSIQAVNLPTFTILDSYVPWLIIGLGFLILFAAVWTRVRIVSKAGAGRKIAYTPPYGYTSTTVDRKKPPPSLGDFFKV
jgi:hypothetical protein